MMRSISRAVVLGGASLVLSGCGALLLEADFDQFNGALGSPAGSIPGSPAGDLIVTQGDDQFSKIAGDALLLRQPGAGTPSGGYSGRLYLISAAADGSGPERTVSWRGRFTGDSAFDTAPLAVDISGQNSGTSVDPWSNQHLRLNISKAGVQLQDKSGNVLESLQPLTPEENHTVWMSLKLVERTYRISIKHPAQPEILWTGSLPTATANVLSDEPRIVLRLGFPRANESTTVSAYTMDDVTIRSR